MKNQQVDFYIKMEFTKIKCIESNFDNTTMTIVWQCNRKPILKDETFKVGIDLVESDPDDYFEPHNYYLWTDSYFTAAFPSLFPNWLIKYFLKKELKKIKQRYNSKFFF